MCCPSRQPSSADTWNALGHCYKEVSQGGALLPLLLRLRLPQSRPTGLRSLAGRSRLGSWALGIRP